MYSAFDIFKRAKAFGFEHSEQECLQALSEKREYFIEVIEEGRQIHRKEPELEKVRLATECLTRKIKERNKIEELRPGLGGFVSV